MSGRACGNAVGEAAVHHVAAGPRRAPEQRRQAEQQILAVQRQAENLQHRLGLPRAHGSDRAGDGRCAQR